MYRGGQIHDAMSPSIEVSKTLNCMDDPMKVIAIDRAAFNQGENALYNFAVTEEQTTTLVARGPGGGTSETVGALCARDYKGVGSQYVTEQKVIVQHSRPSNTEN